MNKREELQKLYDAANIAVKEIHKERTTEVPFRRGGVNWADLRCVDAEYCESVHGGHIYRVTIEEAAPDESELQDAVYKRLIEAGFDGVEVATEW